MKVDIFNTDKKYSIIYADPPWRNKKSGTKIKKHRLTMCKAHETNNCTN